MKKIRQLLYRTFSFEQYLTILSRLYFFTYRTGILRYNSGIQYPYFLKKVVKKGDTVLDIGANLGYFTCLFARWVGKNGKVYAVEPVEPIRKVLVKNSRKYKCVEIYPYALGAENKTIQLGNDSLKKNGYVASGSHFVLDSDKQGENPEIMFQAEMRKGSELFGALPKLDFLKCDVEGYESVIIPEIGEVIKKHLPTILIETGGDNRPKIIEIFQNMGYNPFVLKKGKLYPLQRELTDDILFVHPSRPLTR